MNKERKTRLSISPRQFDRRHFLTQSTMLAMTPLVPGFVTNTIAASRALPHSLGGEQPILVVVEMSGGNDGINTVIPHRQDAYRRNRPKIRLNRSELLSLNDELGLHPQMQGFKSLYDQGQLAVIGGVGYPNPNRSHFESMAIWHSANESGQRDDGLGWLGSYLDVSKDGRGNDLDGWYVGGGISSPALVARRAQIAAVERLQDLQFRSPARVKAANDLVRDVGQADVAAFVQRTFADTFASAAQLDAVAHGKSAGNFPATALGQQMAIISRLIQSHARSRIYYTVQPGYDTHISQLNAHANLLADLSGSIKALMDDLNQADLAERVVILAFSEFGRRVEENASQGTDHGTAGPVFVAGKRVAGGLYGQAPDLENLEAGDLKTAVDFRRVYSTLLDGWLGIPSDQVLQDNFKSLEFIAQTG